MKPICKNCGNDTFRSVSDYGVCTYKDNRGYFFQHYCMKCGHEIYIVCDTGFNNRQQVGENDFEIVKVKRSSQVATDEYEDD